MADTQTSRALTLLPTLLTALNPILLLIGGYYLNSNIERTRLEIEATSARVQDLRTAAEANSIAARTRVDKVKVIADFINDLTGEDERRRQLAIEAVFIALPDEAARLVKAVERFSATGGPAGEKDVAAARDALEYTRARLVAEMFSEDRATRIEALHTLQRGWTDDWILIGLLVDRAMRDVQARAAAGWPPRPKVRPAEQQWASLSNTAEFLSGIRVPADPALKARIEAFAKAAEPNSEDTARFAELVLQKLR
jgi:hypothetical protein